MSDGERSIGEELAAWGKVALLETSGRLTKRPTRTAVGFIEEPGGALMIAAGSEEADWARNLLNDPSCRVTVGERTARYVAAEVDGDDRARALVGLILKYGTPAERLGRGPVFRLQPADAPAAPPDR